MLKDDFHRKYCSSTIEFELEVAFDYQKNVQSDFKRDKVYYSDFKYDEEYFDPDWRFYELTFVLTASVYLMASVVQCSAYLICFPQLRKGLCDVFSKLQCAKSTQDQ